MNGHTYNFKEDVKPIFSEEFSKSFTGHQIGKTNVKILGRNRFVDFAFFEEGRCLEVYFDNLTMTKAFFSKIQSMFGKIKVELDGKRYILDDADKWFLTNQDYDFKETSYSLYFSLDV